MQVEIPTNELIEERRLVTTMISGRPRAGSFYMAGLTVLIMAAFTLVFWLGPEAISSRMPAIKSQVYGHYQLWRVFTAMFIHADLEHFLSNMYMLWIFSFFIFGYFGFWVFPMLSFAMGAAVNAAAILTYSPDTELLGASGLVYLLGGLWLTLYFLIQRQYGVVNRLMRVAGIALVIFVPSTFIPTTSYRTHAIGFLVGVIMGVTYFVKNKNQIRSREVYKVSWV